MSLARLQNAWNRTAHYAWHNLNFFRTHLLIFCITPLIMSAIMYASNGKYQIAYVDALFNSVSAMTVTGLTTINLSGLTGWQQAILYIQMWAGNIVTVSWIMVIVRKSFFEAKVDHIVEGILARNNGTEGSPFKVRRTPLSLTKKFLSRMRQKRQEKREKLRPDMIQRVSAAPQLLNPNGQISVKTPNREVDDPHNRPVDDPRSSFAQIYEGDFQEDAEPDLTPTRENLAVDFAPEPAGHIPSDPARSIGDTLSPPQLPRRESQAASSNIPLPRSLTIEFQEPDGVTRRGGRRPSIHPTPTIREPSHSTEDDGDDRFPRASGHPLTAPTRSFPRTTTMRTQRSGAHTHRTRGSENAAGGLRRTATGEDVGFGGFPMPHQIIARIASFAAPKISNRLHRTISVPARTMSMGSQTADRTLGNSGTSTGLELHARTKSAPYISFDAIIGRNSRFIDLEEEELEELGGVEYRALRMLLWLVPLYLIGIQLVAFIVIAPYMSLGRWKPVFQTQMRPLGSTWYSAFVVTSAYTNSGMSLVDQSMIPFQSAYPQIIFLVWVILAGNTSYPAFFRLTIWIGSKIVSKTSRANETLQFLLDHPRRCFVYLFPSHQTWFLVAFITLLTLTDWVSFLVLDIGNSEIESIPVGRRILDGLLQSAAVRSAGFGIVNLSNLAPAVKVLYVVMMYVSVYPIALSVRSSNVYEERSLGIEEDTDSSIEREPTTKVWGSYLAWHARRQLAFDMWWIVLALVLICIVERGPIDDKSKDGIDIFPILFEVISAYGTVGLSLGAPGQNYSLAGALSPLSKVILCMVMIRGRHRGLPVAIDRAVMLPHEYRDTQTTADATDDEESERSGDRNPGPLPRTSTSTRDPLPRTSTVTRDGVQLRGRTSTIPEHCAERV